MPRLVYILNRRMVLLVLCLAGILPLSAALGDEAMEFSLRQILENIRSLSLSSSPENSQREVILEDVYTVTFPLPCDYLSEALPNNDTMATSHRARKTDNHSSTNFTIYVQESTTTLMAAKALAKTVLPPPSLGMDKSWDDVAWDMLDAALLTLPHDSSDMYFQRQGLLPKYGYIHAPRTATFNDVSTTYPNGTASPYYIPGTRFPHWALFTFAGKNESRDGDTNANNVAYIESSHRLSALPLHASILWDILCAVIPPQHRSNSDNDDHQRLRMEFSQTQEHDGDVSHNQQFPLVGGSKYSYNYDHHKQWWHRVEQYYNRIYQNHVYIHDVVMRGCHNIGPPPKSSHDPKLRDDTKIPCYNILHPWESLVDTTSPVWTLALQPIMEEMQDQNWTLPFVEIPSQVQEAYDFPADPGVYEAMMYLLLEGWNRVNLTEACPTNSPLSCGEEAYWNRTTTIRHINNDNNDTTNAAKFAMLDVGYAAILAQGDADLHQLARVLLMVLPENFYGGSTRRKLKKQLETIEGWQTENRRILEVDLWDDRYNTYQSKLYNNTSGEMEFIDVAVSNNLIPFWYVAATTEIDSDYQNSNANKKHGGNHIGGSDIDAAPNSYLDHDHDAGAMIERTQQHWRDISMQLIRHKDRFAFDCGTYPLWSQGCDQYESLVNTSTAPPMIQPFVNYLIANGLLQNDDNYLDIFGHYISSQSLHMIIHSSNTTATKNATNTTVFGEAYSAFAPYQNLANLDRCGMTSTLTAAIAHNMLVPDPSHVDRLPLPPIQRSWVITLITVELILAFSIGVSCILLSFCLMRKTSFELASEQNGNEANRLMDHDHYENDYDEHVTQEGTPPYYYDATTMSSSPDRTAQSAAEKNNGKEEDSSFLSDRGLN